MTRVAHDVKNSEKTRVRMLNDASLAKLLDHSIAFLGNWAILNVQLLKATTIVGHALDALVADHFTTFHTQLLQVRAILG